MLAGETVIDAVVEPVLHKYALPALEVSVELCPWQIVAGLGVILAVGGGNTVTVVVAVAVHVPETVTVRL